MEEVSLTDERVKGMGDWLIEVHDWFRTELATLRRQAVAGEQLTPSTDLRANCLAFCGYLTRHHTGEDGGVFPMLARIHPELSEVVARLEKEHEVVAEILRELQDLARDEGDRDRLVRGLDRLTAELTGHLRYEEETLFDVLNETPAPPMG
ncbi:hemerythrin domain-containing protein [Actinoplanes sp. NPDC049265]|uniref:hemerythrin domain-containing protein n=1 Tax=Actinoplanes sp. NPDC049265 TaxID=3363902 RepID=UPI00371B2B18